jgi:hypothetical protein
MAADKRQRMPLPRPPSRRYFMTQRERLRGVLRPDYVQAILKA